MSKKRWVVAGVVVVMVGLGYLVYSMFAHDGEYLTVSQLKSGKDAVYGQTIKVGGQVASGSVSWDATSRAMRFSLVEGKDRLDVVYNGSVPDSFKPGGEVVLEGRYTTQGVFEARNFWRRSLCSLCH